MAALAWRRAGRSHGFWADLSRTRETCNGSDTGSRRGECTPFLPGVPRRTELPGSFKPPGLWGREGLSLWRTELSAKWPGRVSVQEDHSVKTWRRWGKKTWVFGEPESGRLSLVWSTVVRKRHSTSGAAAGAHSTWQLPSSAESAS